MKQGSKTSRVFSNQVMKVIISHIFIVHSEQKSEKMIEKEKIEMKIELDLHVTFYL